MPSATVERLQAMEWEDAVRTAMTFGAFMALNEVASLMRRNAASFQSYPVAREAIFRMRTNVGEALAAETGVLKALLGDI